MNELLNQDVNFLIEIDKMKTIYRKIKIYSDNRFENDGEHSYHVTLMALILQDYCNKEIDILKVIRMLLIHDVVEIDAGDTFAYDREGYKTKYDREQRAAKRIFGLLSPDKGQYYYDLYNEFECMESEEAKFANLIDRFQPILLNYLNNGGSWREHGIQRAQVENRIRPFKETSPILYQFMMNLLKDSFD